MQLTFRKYCLHIDREFYEKRPILLDAADQLQAFYEHPTQKVCNLSMPTRLGKSRLGTDFSTWILIRNCKKRVLRVSYAATLAEMFSKQVKDKYVKFFELFSDVKQPRIVGTTGRWSINDFEEYNHIGVGVDGAVTGFGADIAIVDDTAKNMLDATSASYNARLDQFLQSVLIGRLENEKKIINIGTRWTTTDWFTKFNPDVEIIVSALDADERSICEEWKTTAEVLADRASIAPYIFAAQYMQRPTMTGKVRIFETFTFPIVPRGTIDGGGYTDFLIIDPATDFGTDYFVVGLWRKMRGQLYLVDMFAEQSARIESVAEWIKKQTYELGWLEVNGNGKNIMKKLREKGVAKLAGFSTTSDKYSRAYIQLENIENYVSIVNGCPNAALLQTQTNEFPVGDHDDLIDNAVMACERLL